MSSEDTTPHQQTPKPPRVLACVLCQQRKIKCDRNFPCANCIKIRAPCEQAKLHPRRRRRKQLDRELLERVRKYEDLLRENNISFEPLRRSSTDGGRESHHPERGYDSEDENAETAVAEQPPRSINETLEESRGVKNIWHAMSQGFRDPGNESDSSDDMVREAVVKKAWDQDAPIDDQLLFGSNGAFVDLQSFHPIPIHIFRLWQIYTDNVNSLLKITHTPTLQGRIIDAAGNLANIDSTLEALMFGIYATAVQTLFEEDCQTIFGQSKDDLLIKYQYACQQALWKCGFLRTSDRNCLTALCLYLISIRSLASPRALSPMISVAIRIAQRMGINDESTLAKSSVFEAEICRRLWWSLTILDARLNEMSNGKTSSLDPTWDCKVPLNVNEAELRSDSKEPPAIQARLTDALFTVVRCEIADWVRHTSYHLEFTNPALKAMAKRKDTSSSTENDSELSRLEKRLEDQYLRHCNQENPLHFMTVWTTRGHLARCRLLEHYARSFVSGVRPSEALQDIGTSYALKMLYCDTKIMTSPLTRNWHWLNQAQFPFPAYVQLVQHLRRRPICEQAPQAWEIMSRNYEAWVDSKFKEGSPFFQLFVKMILKAWEACETAFPSPDQVPAPPRIVVSLKEILARKEQTELSPDFEQLNLMMSMGMGPLHTPMYQPTEFFQQDFQYNNEMQQQFGMVIPEMHYRLTSEQQVRLDEFMNQMDWTGLENWTNPGL